MIGTFRLPRLHLTRIEAHGVSLDDVMRAAGLPASWLREERLVLSTEQLFAFWTAVGQASTDPLVGLRLGRHDQAQSYDPICLAALSASTFRDAIERAGRYKQITCPEDIRVVDAGRESRVQFRWLLTRDKAPVVLQDLCFAWIHMLGELGFELRRDHRQQIGIARAERPIEIGAVEDQRIRRGIEADGTLEM
jgi:hypothetical protein